MRVIGVSFSKKKRKSFLVLKTPGVRVSAYGESIHLWEKFSNNEQTEGLLIMAKSGVEDSRAD